MNEAKARFQSGREAGGAVFRVVEHAGAGAVPEIRLPPDDGRDDDGSRSALIRLCTSAQ